MKPVKDLCRTCKHGEIGPGGRFAFCTNRKAIKARKCGYKGAYMAYEPTDPAIDREAAREAYYEYQKSLDWLDSANA